MLKKYTVATAGPIPALDNIVGPLNTPTVMDHAAIVAMLNKNYVIYQHNPYDLNEKVRVTKKNINNITFKNTRKSVIEKRKLNNEIQNMSKPIVNIPANAPKNDHKPEVKNDKNDKKDEKKDKQNLNPTVKKDETKVSSPDGFTA